MQEFSFQHLINADSKKVFDAIADFSNYKFFLPGCLESSLLELRGNTMRGSLTFNILSKNYSITSENIVFENMIKIKQIDGPLKQFDATWTVHEIDQGLTSIILEAKLSVPLLLKPIINQTTLEFFVARFKVAFENYLI
jgi:ribosome-associated toxin RatA of RatAB toxin-antitoxin module